MTDSLATEWPLRQYEFARVMTRPYRRQAGRSRDVRPRSATGRMKSGTGRTSTRSVARDLQPGRSSVRISETIVLALARLSPATLPTALELAALPERVRGYEQIKLAGVARFRARAGELRAELTAAPPATAWR
jgi:indolepyruvate ferredoxin oxidoreductase